MYFQKPNNRRFSTLVVMLTSLLIIPNISFAQHPDSAYMEGRPFRNLFAERGLTTSGHVHSQMTSSWSLARYNSDYKLIYDVPNSNPPEAYVLDVHNDDIRSEGLSYGMFVAVLLNDKTTFDKLWRFALNKTRQPQGWFAWQTSASSPYNVIDGNPAPDGEEYMAMALFLAHGRWDSSTGSQNYIQYANDILDVLRTQLFDPQTQLIYFSPATGEKYTDPSYHLPLFYEMWALWANGNNNFWRDAATKSRAFLKAAAHPTTGLFPEYAQFNGQPTSPGTNGNENSGRFAYDSWRVIQNIALDYYWWSRDEGLKDIVERQQAFYESKNFNYMNAYELNGDTVGTDKSQGHVWMNAVSALVSPIYGGYSGAPGANDIGWDLLQDAFDNYWTMPTGQYRYYDGMLHLLGLAFTSGQFNLFGPTVAASTRDSYSHIPQAAQPNFLIRNTTGEAISDFEAKYYFTLEQGKTPVVQDAWTPNASVSLEHINGSLWSVTLDYSGQTLDIGEQTSGEGDRFMLHYSDWSALNKSNDYSQAESSAHRNTVRIGVFDSLGNLLMGSTPPEGNEYPWLDLDTPNASGDWENFGALKRKEPDSYCDNPVRIDARVQGEDYIFSTDTGFPDTLERFDAKRGLVCKNAQQADGSCNDYKVRFYCDGSWTTWLDRDNPGPGGNGDFERTSDFPDACNQTPTHIEAKTTVAGETISAYGPSDQLAEFSTEEGLVCKNWSGQPDGKECNNYLVRFVCQ